MDEFLFVFKINTAKEWRITLLKATARMRPFTKEHKTTMAPRRSAFYHPDLIEPRPSRCLAPPEPHDFK
ncbi:MAG: hypothetical protein ACO1QB_11090 [Verrucomicrobiales bacterium]